jgi:DNA polymerase-1
MLGAFENGEDIHTVTAAGVFNVPQSFVTDEMRRAAKAVNFGIVYGISDFSLAQDIRVTKAQAKQYIDSYLARYSGVAKYMKEVVEKATENGYVTTLLNRRRYLPELASSNFITRSFGQRVALNTPIQGTAADIIKIAMVNTRKALLKSGLKARLILQVHDELIVECKEQDKLAVCKILEEEMSHAATLAVELKVDAHCGKTWLEAKD